MRRSDVVNLLAERLRKIRPFIGAPLQSIEKEYERQLQEMANSLLSDLENLGMKPPSVSGRVVVIGTDSRTGEAAAFDVSGRSVNAWEAEQGDLDSYQKLLDERSK
jgi:hypothetical protein